MCVEMELIRFVDGFVVGCERNIGVGGDFRVSEGLDCCLTICGG